jgi:hypothetical protein
MKNNAVKLSRPCAVFRPCARRARGRASAHALRRTVRQLAGSDGTGDRLPFLEHGLAAFSIAQVHEGMTKTCEGH